MARRWKQRPEGSNWGEFGEDDQLGRLNLLTPERVKRAAQEVREGLRFCLSLPLNLPGGNILNPRRYPPRLQPTFREGLPQVNLPLGRLDPRNTDVICDDAVLIWLQYSTQWDSFAHVGSVFDVDGDGVAEVVYYNGFRGGQHVKGPFDYQKNQPTGEDYRGVEALGVQNYAEQAIQGRGVLIDLRAHFGDERKLVGYDDLMRVMETDRVVVEEGDLALFHTGFAQRILDMGGKPDGALLERLCPALDGRDAKLLKWITDSGVVAMIADNYAVEAIPSLPGPSHHYAMLPIHEHCLFKLGVPLGEIWYLTAFAAWMRANKRSRCLLTAPALRLPGAVGSPVTPVATV
ncbi:MAG: cyclase family protein [Alphaproteobacteria bacterium]|nr:cyclase family protein [Alphaproteobacteria bacterium]